MTKFENHTTIDQPISHVYQFLQDLSNHKNLMPDNIENWTATKDEASFTIKNMTHLSLIIDNRIDNESISAVPKEKAPIAIKLFWKVTSKDATTTVATFTIEADLNMMLKMIASGPLQKLVDHQIKKLKEELQ